MELRRLLTVSSTEPPHFLELSFVALVYLSVAKGKVVSGSLK